MITWQATDLSVSPPSRQVGSADRLKLQFDAGEAVTAGTAKLTRLDTGENASSLIESAALAGQVLTVTVSGMVRSVAYELAVTFTGSDGVRWTRTLVLVCVA
jgi:hypothetical protein